MKFAHSILRLCYLGLEVLYRPHPSCLQFLIRGRVLSTALLLRSWTTLQTLSFQPSVSYVVTKSCASGSSALLFGPYSTDLILFALRISRGGDRLPVTTHAFNHLIFWLSSEELGVPCRPYPFCLQYFMRGRVLPITAWAFDLHPYL